MIDHVYIRTAKYAKILGSLKTHKTVGNSDSAISPNRRNCTRIILYKICELSIGALYIVYTFSHARLTIPKFNSVNHNASKTALTVILIHRLLSIKFFA